MTLKDKILELSKKGFSQRKIVKELNCSSGTVSYHLNPQVKEKAIQKSKINKTLYKKNKKNNCKFCNSPCVTKYCSSYCQHQYIFQKRINSYLSGNEKGYNGKTCQLTPWLKKYLFEIRGTHCSKCNWDKVHPIDNRPLVEINHIDGDATNNKEDNLEILCPNCHAMTPNYKSRNKNSKRIRK